MEIDINTMNFDGDINASAPILDGFYHLQQESCSEKDKENGTIHKPVYVIVGTRPEKEFKSALGRKIYGNICDWTNMGQREIMAFLIAIGYFSIETLKQLKASGQNVSTPAICAFNGNSFLGKVESDSYTDSEGKEKKTKRVTAFYALDSEQAKESGVILNAALLQNQLPSSPPMNAEDF